MKKALLLSTILVSSAFAFADHIVSTTKDMTLSVGGELDVQGGGRVTGNDKGPITPNNRRYGFFSASAIHASLKTAANSGWVYGAQIGIAGTTRSKDAAGATYLDRTYLWAENANIGKFEAGSNQSAANALRLSGASVAVAAGGVDGGWDRYIEMSSASAFSMDNFQTSPSLILKDTNFELDRSHERARKVTFYTPAYNGFRGGVSFTPDAENRGGRSPDTLQEQKSFKKNAISVGIEWVKSFSQTESLKTSVVGDIVGKDLDHKLKSTDESAALKWNKARAILVGAVYKRGDFSYAAGYGNTFKSNMPRISDTKNKYYASAGVAYEHGKSTTSLGYFYSNANKNKFNLVSAGTEYKLAPGIVPYAEVTYFRGKQVNSLVKTDGSADYGKIVTTAATKVKRTGTALILGARITF